jgi:hypothetical protein
LVALSRSPEGDADGVLAEAFGAGGKAQQLVCGQRIQWHKSCHGGLSIRQRPDAWRI